jgi:hypothetical protein
MPKQTSIAATKVIPAPPEREWEIGCDGSRYPEWVENTLRMIRVDARSSTAPSEVPSLVFSGGRHRYSPRSLPARNQVP